MESSLPPFGIRQLRDGEPFSILQINEQQYLSIIEPNPHATLSYIDDDDGEDVTVGSGMELRQRLDEVPISTTAPFVRCYNTVKNEKEDRYVHLFDIQRTNSSQSIWKEHALAYRRARKTYENAQKEHKDNCDNGSISSIDLNSDYQGHYESMSQTQDEQTLVKSDLQSRSQPNQSIVLSDAIPSLVENLANLLQTTSETLRKAAEKSRESQTSPIEDVLSGVSNIVAEIGNFGLSLLDNLNDSIEENRDQSNSTSDAPQSTSATESLAEVTVEGTDQVSVTKDDSDDGHQDKQVDPSTNVSDAGEAKCKFCSLAQLPCHPWTELSTTCGSCMALGQPCTLTPDDTQSPSPVSPVVSKHSEAISPSSKDGSILDQDTEDADFSRRYPPLMSLRRANTIAGLHNHFVDPSSADPDNKGLHRHNSWVNRYPHRPIPQVFDAETNRRRNFARDCFPAQKYTPGSSAQETTWAPTWHYTKPKFQLFPYANRLPENSPDDVESHKTFEAKSADITFASASDVEAGIDVKSAKAPVPIDPHLAKTGPPFEYHKPSTEISPVLNGNQDATTEPSAESSGAFFHRMMRDNPSRRQNHALETNERLTRHRSYSRQRSNNNPFSNINRSNTVSSATNPASRLNHPFDPFNAAVVPADTETLNLEVKTMQNGMDSSTYGTSEPKSRMAHRPHSLQRPFSPVWEEHLNQIKVHKDQINKLDRNGESSSMYSPPPRHMRSTPNMAAAIRASASSGVPNTYASTLTGLGKLQHPVPSVYRNSFPNTPKVIVRPRMPYQLPLQTQAPYQHTTPPYLKSDLNPFNAAAIYAPLPKPKTEQEQVKAQEQTESNDAIDKCISALRDMGYGLGDRNLKSRLHVYAEAAGGDVMEAVDMIEQDKRANSEAAESEDD